MIIAPRLPRRITVNLRAGSLHNSSRFEYVFTIIGGNSGIAALIDMPLETDHPVIRFRGAMRGTDPEQAAKSRRRLWVELRMPFILLTRSVTCYY